MHNHMLQQGAYVHDFKVTKNLHPWRNVDWYELLPNGVIARPV